MHKVTRAVLARIAMRRAEGAGGRTATPRWKRIAASTVPLLLVAALVATILLTSGLGLQPASATQPCENGTVVPSPADNPGLADDCALLLAAMDTLRGTATLNWSATTAITDWTGITVGTVDGARRVTLLNLERQGIDGTLPAALGGLTGLSELRLSWRNQLTGSIPPELGQLTRLAYLGLARNHLTGPIPPELGAIGPQLTSLVVSGPQPLPAGIGLTGSIPPQLGNLSGLKYLYLDGNRLTGSIPTRLRWLTDLRGLYLSKNQLSGAIPTQLGSLSMLTYLLLTDNQLTGAIPTQLEDLHSLRKVYLRNNGGFTGCVPRGLRDVRYHDVGQLNLPVCPYGAPDTPATPLPTYTLTVTAGQGGSVDPAGATTHDEAAEVTLTASWSDATHTFAGWSGDCSGAATACTLEMYADHSVTATFTELSATRCDAPEDADCIRAVYLGAPDDYPQVQDIPADLLLTPDANGRYEVERGLQVTVVTAAPLPASYTRFYLQQDPVEQPWPVSSSQLIPPVGTTYTFTPSTDPAAADLITFDLHAARPWPFQRPGLKPELGDVIVRTTFAIPPPPLTLELTSSRQLCTANTLTELSWTIAGGRPPYTLTIDGETVDANAESHRANCGAIPADPFTGDPLPNPTKTFTATVTDSQSIRASTSGMVAVTLADAIESPSQHATSLGTSSGVGIVIPNDTWRPDLKSDGRILVRHRPIGTHAWAYDSSRRDLRIKIDLPSGVHDSQMAYARHPLEAKTPDALNWNRAEHVARLEAAPNLAASSSHDMTIVTFDEQLGAWGATVRLDALDSSGGVLGSVQKSFVSSSAPRSSDGRIRVVFHHIPPSTALQVHVWLGTADLGSTYARVHTSTGPAPPGWSPSARGPQMLRASSSPSTITVRWDPPYVDPDIRYRLAVNEVESGRSVHTFFLGPEQREWIIRGGLYDPLRPDTEYHIVVTHLGLPSSSAEIVARTLPDPTSSRDADSSAGASQGRAVPGLDRLFWPVLVDADYDVTDDPFTWRGDVNGRFHAGLDVGSGEEGPYQPFPLSDREVRLQGGTVFAAASGTLLIFNHDLSDWIVSYCPGLGGSLANQFIAASGAQMQVGGKGCWAVAGATSGRVALVIHNHTSVGVLTKYGHLQFIESSLLEVALIDPTCPERDSVSGRIDSTAAKTLGCTTIERLSGDEVIALGFDPRHTDIDAKDNYIAFALPIQIAVSRGARIGGVGNSYDGQQVGFDETHLHFEIREFTGDAHNWYVAEATGCSTGDAGNADYGTRLSGHCHWSPSAKRNLPTIHDVEQYLPPLPASTVPRDHGGWWGIDAAPTTIQSANADRRVFEIESVSVVGDTVKAKVSSAIWRPVAYSRYSRIYGRTDVPGIASTGPGVTAYGTDIVAGPNHSDVACGGGRFQAASVATDATTEGELPRETREVNLSAANSVCFLYVLTTNASYPAPDVSILPNPLDPYRKHISIPDPIATLVYAGTLMSGSRDVSGLLSGIQFRFYEVGVYAASTYEFCTTQVSGACVDEAAGAGTVLELWQGANRLGLSEESNLSWTADYDGAVFLVVRGDYASGAAAPNAGPYTLYYDIPPPNTCGPYGTSGARAASDTDSATTCVPQIPVLERVESTSNSITVRWNNVSPVLSPGAVRYELRIDGGTAQDPNSPDGMDTRSHRFGTLTPNTLYEIQIRALLGTVESAWSMSQGVYTLTARPVVPPAPAGLRVTEVTDTSARLHWDGVTGATAYKTRRDGVTSPLQPVGRVNSHPFSGLTAHTAHELEVAASNSSGDSEFVSLTLLLPPTGLTPTPTQDSITLSWTALAGLTYEVKLGAGSAAPARYPASHTFGGLTSDTPFTLYVRARNTQGASAWEGRSARTLEQTDPCTRPASTRTIGVSETRWAEPSGGSTSEERRNGGQGQVRTVTGPDSNCNWNTGEWTNAGSPVWGGWSRTGVSRPAPAKPSSSNQVVVDSETRWTTPSAGITFEEEREQIQTQLRSVTWNQTACTWNVGMWGNVGSPDWGSWGRTGVSQTAPAKPSASGSRVVTTETRWAYPSGGVTNEEARDLNQPQIRTVTWDEDDCEWDEGGWRDDPDEDPVWGQWGSTGVNQSAPAKPPANGSRVVTTETRWAYPSGGVTNQEARTQTQAQIRSVTWDETACTWDVGQWRDDPDEGPVWGQWDSTSVTKPAPPKPGPSRVVTLNPPLSATQCVQRGSTVYEQQRTATTATQAQTVSWDEDDGDWNTAHVGAPVPNWSAWADTGNNWPQPNAYIEYVTLETITQTQWDRRDVVVCLEYEQRRTGTRQSAYLRPYVWNASAKAWVVGPRNPSTPIFMHPPGIYSFTAWSDTGVTRLCPFGGRDADEAGGGVSAQLPSGDYVMQWGDLRMAFTVPANATIELSTRSLDSGVDAAVFSLQGGAELVVEVSTLTTDLTQNASLFTDVTDATLAALAATLRLVEPAADAPAPGPLECPPLTRSDAGTASVDFNEAACAAVHGGGALVAAHGEHSLSLTLPTSHDWLLVRSTSAGAVVTLTLVELSSGGYLTLSFADATELARHIPEGNTDLPALFDAMVPDAPDDDGS